MQDPVITYTPIHVEGEPTTDKLAQFSHVKISELSGEIFSQIAVQIVAEQKKIIGILAIEQASMVEGISFDPISHKPVIVGNGAQVIDALITQYRNFFGKAAVEVCRDAASPFISQLSTTQMPNMLKP